MTRHSGGTTSARGHGTSANDRPAVTATIGRRSGRARLRVIGNSGRRTLEALVAAATTPGATVNTDEWRAYAHLPELDQDHATVDHVGGGARDDDSDGVRGTESC